MKFRLSPYLRLRQKERPLSGCPELKVKETNRIDTVVDELSKLGATIKATDDGMIIHGKSKLGGGVVSSLEIIALG